MPRASGDRPLDLLLDAAVFPEHSRAAFQRALEAGLVKADGKVIAQDDEVRGGQVLEFSMPETKPAELRPVEIPLDLVFEDKHLIVLNKPAGMVVHPGVGTGEDTLVHALLAHCAGSLSGIGGIERPGIVHRLDKDTTGVMVVAKTDAAHRSLSRQFADHGRTGELRRGYLAFVWGVPDRPKGTVNKPLGRHPHAREKIAVRTDGREAVTHWEVRERYARGEPTWKNPTECGGKRVWYASSVGSDPGMVEEVIIERVRETAGLATPFGEGAAAGDSRKE